jgi:hypothetical protein
MLWWLGDWWNAGVQWGDGKAACEELGIDYGSAANAGRVAKVFQCSRRREHLSFRHHTEVCAIDDPTVQDRLLDWCAEPLDATGKPRSTRDLREAVRQYLDDQGRGTRLGDYPGLCARSTNPTAAAYNRRNLSCERLPPRRVLDVESGVERRMVRHDTITMTIELDVPAELVTTLVKRHILRVLRGSRNGHAPGSPITLSPPDPLPPPQEEHAPAVSTLDHHLGQASAGAP